MKNKKRFLLTKQKLILVIAVACLIFLVYFLSHLSLVPKEKTFLKEEKDWIEDLPWRLEVPNISSEYVWGDSSMEGLWYVPCGSTTLYTAYAQLGKPVDFLEINRKRTGGFWRGFLSIFNKEARHITWGHEIISISEGYGFEVEHLKGQEATLENARKYSREDSVVIMHTVKHLFRQHWEVYDTNLVKNTYYSGQNYEDVEMDFEGWKIWDLVIIKNPSS